MMNEFRVVSGIVVSFKLGFMAAPSDQTELVISEVQHALAELQKARRGESGPQDRKSTIDDIRLRLRTAEALLEAEEHAHRLYRNESQHRNNISEFNNAQGCRWIVDLGKPMDDLRRISTADTVRVKPAPHTQGGAHFLTHTNDLPMLTQHGINANDCSSNDRPSIWRYLEREEKSRLVFIIETLVAENRRTHQTNQQLKNALEETSKIARTERERAVVLDHHNTKLRANLVAANAATLELQSVLERLQTDMQHAHDYEGRLSEVLEQCNTIASEFKKVGKR